MPWRIRGISRSRPIKTRSTAPLVSGEREAFAVNTFQPASSWELAQRKEFVWENAGRLGHSTGSRTACTVASRRVPWIQLHFVDHALRSYRAQVSHPQ